MINLKKLNKKFHFLLCKSLCLSSRGIRIFARNRATSGGLYKATKGRNSGINTGEASSSTAFSIRNDTILEPSTKCIHLLEWASGIALKIEKDCVSFKWLRVSAFFCPKLQFGYRFTVIVIWWVKLPFFTIFYYRKDHDPSLSRVPITFKNFAQTKVPSKVRIDFPNRGDLSSIARKEGRVKTGYIFAQIGTTHSFQFLSSHNRSCGIFGWEKCRSKCSIGSTWRHH